MFDHRASHLKIVIVISVCCHADLDAGFEASHLERSDGVFIVFIVQVSTLDEVTEPASDVRFLHVHILGVRDIQQQHTLVSGLIH